MTEVPSYDRTPSTARDLAAMAATMMTEADSRSTLKGAGFTGDYDGAVRESRTAVGNVVANRTAAGFASSPYDVATQGRGSSVPQFSAANTGAWARAYDSALSGITSGKFSNPELAQTVEIAKGITSGTVPDITKGATHFVGNSAAMLAESGGRRSFSPFHEAMFEKNGYVQIGSQRFGYDTDPSRAFDARSRATDYSAYGPQTTPTEQRVMDENMARQRDVFRGPTDFGSPVWDGTWDKSVVPVETAPIADIPSFDLGANLNSAVTSSPFGDASIPQGSLASAYDYSALGPDLGANLSSALSSSDLMPSISPYGFAGGFSPQNAAMNEATGYLGGIYAGSVPGGGQFTPDDRYAPGPDLGGNLSSMVPSDYAAADSGWGRAADKDTSLAPQERAMTMGYQPGFGQVMGSMGVNPGFGAGIVSDLPSVGWGKAIDKDVSPASYALGPDLGFNLSNAMPSDKPFSAPAPQATTLPGYALPDDVLAPDPSRPAAPTQASPSRSAPSAAPTGFRSSPTPAAPAMAPAVNFPTMGVREASPAPSQTYQDALAGFGSSKDFLGSVMGGNRGGLEALSGLTGTNYAGLAQMAMSGDQYAQPAMLGLERAYSNAVGQPGNLSLFGGGNSGTRTDNLGPVVDQATGQVLGNYDPSDPKNQGLFGGIGGWLGGLFGGGDSYGNTPGAGGLY